MATSAFRSTTKRTPIGASPSASAEDSTSSNRSSAHRRSRSLSRFSHRLPEPEVPSSDDAPAPRGRFVNTVRGSGFPEISLDDLAIEFFCSGDRGRSGARNADVSPRNGESVSQRRGRSVSRQSLRTAGGGADRRSSVCNASAGGRTISENHSRRRRSLSVVRCPINDSESDLDHSHHSFGRANLNSFSNGSNQKVPSGKLAATPQRPGLRRSLSQKDFKPYDGDSLNLSQSQSSALTDDEVRDTNSAKDGIERTIRAVYAQRKAEHPIGDDMNGELREVMRKELRHAVEEIKMGIEQVMSKGSYDPENGDGLLSKNSDVLQAVSTIRRNYSNKLGQSEKRKQDLLAEIVMEEQRGRELSEIVKELLPEPNASLTVKPSRTRRRSNDKSRMSKRLSQEAEKYIEDFISNVEDTDISSLDGERSDTSSTIGGIVKIDTFQSPAPTKPLPVEMDGVVLPWLQWETSNDVSPESSCKKKMESPVTPVSSMWSAAREANNGRDQSGYTVSSHGSWNPETLRAPMAFREPKLLPGRSPSVDIDEYLKATADDDLLFERWSQKQRISSGGLLLCNNINAFF
ncbi:uncharacterized protein LOC116189301 isoform X1 [Punica granatum]|uniref:Uncharacterized protein LOC116189301 isoform X1 n=1 Tax=Punica granatum TaxID=22663 RepID=A0A6P8C007_PUNGR|nr:uncharacterized protein LOC116189301 isoform X1 [Punica granatum]